MKKATSNSYKLNLMPFILLVLALQSIIIYYIYTNNSFFNSSDHSESILSSSSFIQNDLTTVETPKKSSQSVKLTQERNVQKEFEKIEPHLLSKNLQKSGDLFHGPFFKDIQLLRNSDDQFFEDSTIPEASKPVIEAIIGKAYSVNFPDLVYRSKSEIFDEHPTFFNELASVNFFPSKNPCYKKDFLRCLPYFYILGQPKSGTSDLYNRLLFHPHIVPPGRKEVRWFTRGEFLHKNMVYEDYSNEVTRETKIGKKSLASTYTSSFTKMAKVINSNKNESVNKFVTLDGGPHLLWWPVQDVEGGFPTRDIPVPQLLRELHSTTGQRAKFIITLNDPVKRMLSDYYFLDDDLKPVYRRISNKSSKEFHQRTAKQVSEFKSCVDKYLHKLIQSVQEDIKENKFDENLLEEYKKIAIDLDLSINPDYYPYLPFWFRASQFCAHDRHSFGVGGHGRLTISLYSLFVEKYLEHFSPDEILILNLHEYDVNPQEYLTNIYNFLDLEIPDSLERIIVLNRVNVNKNTKEPIYESTELLLRDFFRPYNQILASITNNKSFLWDDINLRESMIKDLNKQAEEEDEEDDGEDQTKSDQKTDQKAANLDNHSINRIKHMKDPQETVDTSSPSLRENLEFRPKSFLLDGLRLDDSPHTVLPEDLKTSQSIAEQLCIASYSTNFANLQYLLHTVGVNPNSIISKNLNAFQCLSYIYNVGEANSRSFIFAELKGVNTWLTDLFEPKMDVKSNSILSRNITLHLNNRILDTAKWLYRAGVEVNFIGRSKTTPLHISSYGGLTDLVKFMLDIGANPNVQDKSGRTPAHYASFYGHIHVLKTLKDNNADFNILDANDVTALEVISNPGPVFPQDAKEYLNINQRKPRQINRVMNPELYPDDPEIGWIGGTGGYGIERLEGYENDLDCTSVDQYYAHEISGEDIFYNYLARNSPVLIRGLIDHWSVIQDMSFSNLTANHGSYKVSASNIPYATKFGTDKYVMLSLGDYLQTMANHNIVGGDYPWYVFKGFPIPQSSEASDSVLPYETCPFHPNIIEAFGLNSGGLKKTASLWDGNKLLKLSKSEREMWVNAQWAVGGEGTGAPVHFHNTAISTLIYGAKKWLIYPPTNMIMSNSHIKEFFEKEYQFFYDNKVIPTTCVQTAGDTIIIPESWGHGVLNIQESVAIATDYKSSQIRIEGFPLISKLKNFDNNSKKKSGKILKKSK